MEYTKGEWGVEKARTNYWITSKEGYYICRIEGWMKNKKANAHLIASAPLGYELAKEVVKISATWIDDGLLEIGEGDYTLLKKLAIELLAKAEGK